MNTDMDDPEEVKVYCSGCNGYLFSCSIYERDPKDNLVPCPMQLDPSGKCTGRLKRQKP